MSKAAAFRLAANEAEDQGQERVYKTAGGGELVCLVAAVPSSTDERIRREVLGKLKAGKAARDTAARAAERANAIATRRAVEALRDTRGFEMEIVGATSAAEFSRLLGEEHKPGDVVTLDGRWTPALKAAVLGGLLPLAHWISEEAYRVQGLQVQEDEDLGETSAAS
jgi:hypothetical protein